MLAVHDAYTASIAVTSRLSSLGYSGEHFDAKAQQQYLRARFYDPTNGRFNRLDPFAGNMQEPQSLHKYAYVHGDPIQGTDPTRLLTSAEVNVSMAISIGISVGFTAMLVNSATNLIGDLVYAQALKAGEKASNLDVETYTQARRKRDRSKRYFVHGTTTAVWKGSLQDIAIFYGRPLDFGYGFYTRRFDLQRYSEVSRFAQMRSNAAKRPNVPENLSNTVGGLPFVVEFSMKWTHWDQLSKKYYGSPEAPDPSFEPFVNLNRSGGGPPLTGKDVVYGPTAVKDPITQRWVSSPTLSTQFKFEYAGIRKLRPAFVLPAKDLINPAPDLA